MWYGDTVEEVRGDATRAHERKANAKEEKEIKMVHEKKTSARGYVARGRARGAFRGVWGAEDARADGYARLTVTAPVPALIEIECVPTVRLPLGSGADYTQEKRYNPPIEMTGESPN